MSFLPRRKSFLERPPSIRTMDKRKIDSPGKPPRPPSLRPAIQRMMGSTPWFQSSERSIKVTNHPQYTQDELETWSTSSTTTSLSNGDCEPVTIITDSDLEGDFENFDSDETNRFEVDSFGHLEENDLDVSPTTPGMKDDGIVDLYEGGDTEYCKDPSKRLGEKDDIEKDFEEEAKEDHYLEWIDNSSGKCKGSIRVERTIATLSEGSDLTELEDPSVKETSNASPSRNKFQEIRKQFDSKQQEMHVPSGPGAFYRGGPSCGSKVPSSSTCSSGSPCSYSPSNIAVSKPQTPSLPETLMGDSQTESTEAPPPLQLLQPKPPPGEDKSTQTDVIDQESDIAKEESDLIANCPETETSKGKFEEEQEIKADEEDQSGEDSVNEEEKTGLVKIATPPEPMIIRLDQEERVEYERRIAELESKILNLEEEKAQWEDKLNRARLAKARKKEEERGEKKSKIKKKPFINSLGSFEHTQFNAVILGLQAEISQSPSGKTSPSSKQGILKEGRTRNSSLTY